MSPGMTPVQYLLLQLCIWVIVGAIYTVLFSVGTGLEEQQAGAAPPAEPRRAPEYTKPERRAA